MLRVNIKIKEPNRTSDYDHAYQVRTKDYF